MWKVAEIAFLILLTVSASFGGPCSNNWLDCGNGKCVAEIWICDGENDCGNLKDEQDCDSTQSSIACMSSQFECAVEKHCIPETFRCDGEPDCTDGSDELNCGDTCANMTCSQNCIVSPFGPQCFCDKGYTLDTKDNRTCLDVNECLEEGFCSQICTNLPGGFNCSCLDGYELMNRTCLAIGPDPLLLFSTLDEIRALKLRSGRYFTVRKTVARATAVDADPTSQRVYWVEITNRSSVYSVKMDGTDLKLVLGHGLLIPEDIAVDFVARNLYITDSGLKQVLACKMDGTMCHVLHNKNVIKPRSIVVDPSEGFLYWSDWSDTAAGIYRSGMDGTQKVTFVSRNISWPNGIAIDHTTSRLYWADAKRNTIEYITLNGSTRKVLLDSSVYHPHSLTVFEDHIYWTDRTTFSLESCNKFTGHKMTIMTREIGKLIMGLHVYHPALAPRGTKIKFPK